LIVTISCERTCESNEHLAARFARDAEPLFDVLSRGARRLTRSDADAEDLLQDTLLHAFAGFRTFREGTNLKAWLFRILYNRWINAYRSKQSRPAEVSLDKITERDLAGWAARLPAGQRSAEADLLDSLPDSEITAAMSTLPASFRIVVYLVDVQGYTYAETAAMLSIPLGTVMSRVSRSRQRLRLALAHVARHRRDVAAVEQRIA
jgi:RNA polymerase sigma-70 factor (TIGR02947 family)